MLWRYQLEGTDSGRRVITAVALSLIGAMPLTFAATRGSFAIIASTCIIMARSHCCVFALRIPSSVMVAVAPCLSLLTLLPHPVAIALTASLACLSRSVSFAWLPSIRTAVSSLLLSDYTLRRCAHCGAPIVGYELSCTPDRPYVYFCLRCADSISKIEHDTDVDRVRACYQLSDYDSWGLL